MCHKTRGGCSNHQSSHSNHTCNQAQVQGQTTTSTTTTTTTTQKWVKNLSGVPLTKAQTSFLAYGPGFAVAPKHPHGDYIAAIEQACTNFEPHNAEELRAEIRGAPKTITPPRRNISREESQALEEVRKDQSRVILTADKGVALVIMDRNEYNNKAQELLEDKRTYKEISTDPTNKLKAKLISLLKKIKADGGINKQLYKMYPTGAVAPKFYGLAKIHKRDIPLRPIVSSRGSINYEVAKELARILRPLVGNPHTTLRTLVTLYSKSEGSDYNQENVLLHMRSLHFLHWCLQNLPSPS